MTNTNKKLGLHVLNFKLSYNFSLSVRHKQGRYCNTKFVSVFCKKTSDSKEFCDMAGNNTEEVEGSTNTDSKTNTTAELPPEFLIKHPLQNIWSLWFYDNDRTKTWEENLIELTTFDTVEDFWRLYHHIKLPSELRQGHDYAVFKQGIRPMWEDDANKMGGRWLISLEKKQRNSDLDRFWLDVVLLLIGENFEHSEEICGAVVNVRAKLDKIGVWTADTSKQQANLEIGRKIKEQLGIHGKIGFQLHRDTMVKHSSATKNLYTV